MPERTEVAKIELENTLIELWRAKLGKPELGRDDNFFEQGGDSLLAADVLMDVYLTLHHEVDAWVLFMRPTVAELAAAIVDGQPAPE